MANTYRMGGETDHVSTPATSGYLKPARFTSESHVTVTEFDHKMYALR